MIDTGNLQLHHLKLMKGKSLGSLYPVDGRNPAPPWMVETLDIPG
jgi:hypothetical protein